ncbi:FUSC family protein [Rhizobium sp. C1]|uniref:FUSC family protein n=1 Tax=Rhizobium sp. C1 TaxID=1349799 RepID=UPI001E5C02A3|nr:FUSC family protein [Rhizobium sp. C1]MCD2177616.1 FUSC family protein [Rhizobium sp. C1]
MLPRLTVRDIAYVVRCAGAATLAYVLAVSVFGLVHPVWAAVSAIVVSQEKLFQTRNAMLWRFAGTIVGIAVAVAAGTLTNSFGWDIALQMGASVAICAALVRRWPDLRVAMWTAPIVFFSHDSATSLLMSGYARGTEVILGGIIGAAAHWVTEQVITRPSEGTNSSPAP